MKKLLFVTRTMNRAGTEKVIIQLCSFFKDTYEITVVSMGGEYTSTLDEMGIKHVKIDDIASKNPFKMLRTLKTIKRLIKNNDYDVIHTHHRMAAFFVSLCDTGKARLVHTMHNSFSDKVKLTNKALKNFTVVCCGNTVREDTLKYYNLDENKVVIINNTIIEAPFEKSKSKNDKFTFGYLGRFVQQKGTDFLVRSFINNNVDAKLVLYGYGDQKDMLIQLVKDNKAEDRISFGGFADNIVQAMQSVDCIVLPSRWEGLPLIVLESFYAEKPILVSNIKNNIELVNEKTGLIFKVDDEKDLIEKMILAMKIDLSKFTQEAKKVYLEKYSNEHFYKEYKSVYEN